MRFLDSTCAFDDPSSVGNKLVTRFSLGFAFSGCPGKSEPEAVCVVRELPQGKNIQQSAVNCTFCG